MMNDLMAGQLQFEQAQADDLDRIVAIERAAFTAPWTRGMFEAELHGNPFSRLVVARWAQGERKSDIVGYLCVWIVFEELRLMNLAVEAGSRRQGIAKALVAQAMASARAQGADRAVLEVRASNESARRLYEGLGFRHVANRARYYTNPIEDAVLMRRESLETQ